MKRLYWRPAGPTLGALGALAGFCVALLLVVERYPLQIEQSAYRLKLEASLKAATAFSAIKSERLKRGIAVSSEADPADTGLIGQLATDVTTSTGNLESKRTSANPNLAAVVVHYFSLLHLKPGDVVAVGCSGSFPALNVAVLAAASAMGLRPLVISSVTSSDWGANIPEFMWPDMERVLSERELFQVRSLALSVGGVEDQAVGLSAHGKELVEQVIARSGVAPLHAHDLLGSLEARLRIYEQAAAGRPIRAYVNVGGGAVSVGGSRGKAAYGPGLHRPGPKAPFDSMIGRFLERGVPVVHLTQVKVLAAQFGLPVNPRTLQAPGTGELFQRREPNRLLALLALLAIGAALYFVARRARIRAHLTSLPEGEELDARAAEARRR